MIRWSDEKDQWLRRTRRISFAEIAEMILNRQYLEIVENPSRENQQLFVLRIKGYTWAVPFVIDEDDSSIFSKSAFPSRKLHARYGGKLT
jgi:hypothetical protein